MKRFCLSILFLLSVFLSASACYSERLRQIYKVDGVYYAYEGFGKSGRWWVAGFVQDQDSVVLKSKVIIKGKEEIVEDIHIVQSTLFQSFGSPRVLVIEDGFKVIAHLDLHRLEKLYIPKTLVRTHDQCVTKGAYIESLNLKSIVVDKQNKHLKSVDGVLFTNDGKYLLKYPSKKTGAEYAIPVEVEAITYGAFAGCQLKKIYYPKKKKSMKSYELFDIYSYEETMEGMGFDLKKIQFIGR